MVFRKLSDFTARAKGPTAAAFSAGALRLLTAYCRRSAGGKQRSGANLLLRQAVPIKFQRRPGRFMPQQRADGLNIHAQLHQPCGEIVTKRMKMNAGQADAVQQTAESPLQRARLGGARALSKDKSLGRQAAGGEESLA